MLPDVHENPALTVGKLIEILSKQNPEREVVISITEPTENTVMSITEDMIALFDPYEDSYGLSPLDIWITKPSTIALLGEDNE